MASVLPAVRHVDDWIEPMASAPPDRPPRLPRTLFVDDAARLLGVSRRTVYYRISEGVLHTIRTRCGSQRVLVESIETLLREQRARHSPRRCRFR